MNTDELREKYLAFFETKGCVRRPSDVLVPRWDRIRPLIQELFFAPVPSAPAQ